MLHFLDILYIIRHIYQKNLCVSWLKWFWII